MAWTSAPFASDAVAVGPASLELRLASTAPETIIWVTLSDVSPDGTARPIAAGRLLGSFPDVDEDRSRVDATGAIVQPYGIFHPKTPVPVGEDHLYRVEIWPIGNQFKAGHRLRVHVVGVSGVYTPSVPAINTITDGTGSGSRLLFPLLSDDPAAVFAHADPAAAAPGSETGTPSDRVAAPAAETTSGRLPGTGGAPNPIWAIAALLGAILLRKGPHRRD